MQIVNSSSSVASPPREKASHHDDELFMQQRVLFSENLNELKNLRKELYSAAEYFEMSYSKEDQQQLVVETLKDYVMKAVINTVDHLGSMAYKVNVFLDDKVDEVSETELRMSCIQQRLRTCEDFIGQGGVSKHSLAISFPMHHRRYTLPVGAAMDAVGQSALAYRSPAEYDFFEVKSATRDTSPIVSEMSSALHSPESSPGAFQFPRIASKHEKRTVSPLRFPLPRCGTHVKRSSTLNSSSSKQQYSSEPWTRRSTSLSLNTEKSRTRDTEQHSGKNKRFYKALLSFGKSRKDATFYKYLDEN
ncbi:protein ABIL2-like isoform X1 [Pyrus x bretschneideri]|uniref:protein ABIL2-like isoform X1 n=2 Tax=Pyrus x bretschneideri TaxID=225117 RepID=UPI00202E6CC8|nr:protein ABIL2-like isoform X1 [Pyrus x bretschneideri]XP_048422511.1 protein ABIL2-like isoform X1 [Pyrus x bretschneideri]